MASQRFPHSPWIGKARSSGYFDDESTIYYRRGDPSLDLLSENKTDTFTQVSEARGIDLTLDCCALRGNNAVTQVWNSKSLSISDEFQLPLPAVFFPD
jgi:hypothetical protein